MRAIIPFIVFFGFSHADELPRKEVKSLVNRYFSSGDSSGLKEEISTRPDINPDLFEMLRIAIEKEDWELIGPPMNALSQRRDLSNEEIKVITERLNQYADSYDPNQQLNASFVRSGLPIRRNYPSSENEALVIEFLRYDDPLTWKSAIYTLEAIGTDKSLPALRAFTEKTKPAPGTVGEYHDLGMSALKTIERRENERIKPGSESSGTATNSKNGPNSAKDHSPSASSKENWLWMAVSLALLAASIGYLKWLRRSQE